MALNAQQKRVSKNRVSITYDVEDGGSKQNKELPFVTAMIGGYSGDREDKEDLEERTFYGVDKDNFNDDTTQLPVGSKTVTTHQTKRTTTTRTTTGTPKNTATTTTTRMRAT